jgi:flagellum-specific ATP synthase
VLDRSLAAEGHYPPIQIVDSISRLMPAVTASDHREAAQKIRHWLALYRRSEDLIRVGAYVRGTDLELDQAVMMRNKIRELLVQRSRESAASIDSVARLLALAR